MKMLRTGILAAMNENPSPMDTDPIAMGSDVSSAVRREPVRAAPIDIAQAMFVAMNADREATSRLFSTALRLVAVPLFVLAAIALQALSVKEPSLVKKAL